MNHATAEPLPAHPSPADRGSGLLGTCFGVVFFLGFLLLATQVAVGLYARSVVTSAALDAGRIMASAGGEDGTIEAGELLAARAAATTRVRELLGADAQFQVTALDLEADRIEVSVTAARPRLLWGGGTLGSDVIERRVQLRLEQLQ